MIFIDNGFSHRKIIANSQRIKFSSFVGDYQNAKDDFGTQNLSIQVEGLGEWSFGHTARLQSSMADRLMSSDWIFKPDYIGGMLLGISMGYDGNPTTYIPCDIVTGLPGHDYRKDADFIQAFKDNCIGKYSIQRNGTKQTIEIKNVYVTSQAYGPVFLHILDEAGRFIRPNVKGSKLRFGSVNIGFNTVEASEVEVDIRTGRPIPAKGFEASELDGVHILVNRYQDYLRSIYRKRFNTNQVIDIIENDGFWLDGGWEDFNPVELKREYAEKIQKICSNVWGDAIRDLYRIVFTGGGANIIRGLMPYPQTAIADDPQWECVRGYQRLSKAR